MKSLSLLLLAVGILFTTGCATAYNAVHPNRQVMTETGTVIAVDESGNRVTAEIKVTVGNTIIFIGETSPSDPAIFRIAKSAGADFTVWGKWGNKITSKTFARTTHPAVFANIILGFPGVAVGATEALTPVGKTYGIAGKPIKLSFPGAPEPINVTPSAAALPSQLAPPVQVVQQATQVAPEPDGSVQLALEVARLRATILEQQLQMTKALQVTNVVPPAIPRDEAWNIVVLGKPIIGTEKVSSPPAK